MHGDRKLRPYDLSLIEVLVVDDSPHMLKLLRLILSSMEIRTVHCVEEPESALDQIIVLRPHLVITDILMQPIDGLALTKAIRGCDDGFVRFTPVFVLSGFTDRAHVLEACNAGAHAVLAKPVSPKTLYQRIHALIEYPPDFIETPSYFGPERRTRSAPTGNASVGGEEAEYLDIDVA